MCGFVGIVRNGEKIDLDLLAKSRDRLYKRGPDDSGLWIEDNIGLGHRRLSILDLSQNGHQPMISYDGRYAIVYNGEIYNFEEIRSQLECYQKRWKSRSDTEVILAAYESWGEECLQYFHGMFAFSIWDRMDKTFFAARDRLGVKPYYYHCSSDCFAFASRPGALLTLLPEMSREIDFQGLRFYLEMGYIPAPYSIFQGIRKLPPAHYLIFNQRGLQIKRYWDFRHIRPQEDWAESQEEDLLEELDEILSRCVRSRLVSDVPLGAFLSGGIDSSLVVALMAKYSREPVRTFTIGFVEKKYDESPHAQTVAHFLGTKHSCEIMRVDDLLEFIPLFLEEYDEPFFDSSAFPTMAVSKMTRKHVTVSLSGDGGDELFGGYHYYQIVQKLSFFYFLPKYIRVAFSSFFSCMPRHKFKLLAGAMSRKDILAAFAFSRSIAKDFAHVMNSEMVETTIGVGDLFSKGAVEFPSSLRNSEKAMRIDALYTLPDDYLQKVDVASMAFSLEAREPLLDQDLAEWAMKLPLSWKLRNGTNKYLLRKLAYRYVPKEILNRPKQGFEVPIGEWLRGSLRRWAEDRLNERSIFAKFPLDQAVVLKLWKLHLGGGRNVYPLLWAILIFIGFFETQLKSEK